VFPVGVTPASANHIYATYGQRGLVWFAAFNDLAIAYVTSDNCNPRELEAYDRVHDTTVNEFPTRWPGGIRMSRESNHPCDGTVTKNVDIKLSYEPASHFVRDDGSSYGGYNESFKATESWCDIWSAHYPCGSHWSVVHLNQSRFGESGYSDHYKRRLIMHETGHSFGLAHHCSSDSIMNDGTSGCNGGAWTNINGYQNTDLDGIRNVYPNWKYN
jgi:hypothetical protein